MKVDCIGVSEASAREAATSQEMQKSYKKQPDHNALSISVLALAYTFALVNLLNPYTQNAQTLAAEPQRAAPAKSEAKTPAPQKSETKALSSPKAEPGWFFDQSTAAWGKQLVYITPRALSIALPKQKYKIYSFAPKWNVLYVNENTGAYLDFPHDKFLGSIMGRMGTQLGNDVQFIALPAPRLLKEKGLEYSVYDHKLEITEAEWKQLRIKNSATALYAPRSIKAKYLRMHDTPKEAEEVVCKVSCVPMSSDFPINFTCKDGFRRSHDYMVTLRMNKEKAISILAPDLKKLKQVKTEHELFGHARVSDVFELFDDGRK